MKQVWNDLLKVYDNVPETMAEYNASQPQRAPSVSELPPMPATAPAAPTADTGFFGTLKNVASGIGGWLSDTPPTGSPAFPMPQDTKDTMVGPVFSDVDMPVANPAPPPQPVAPTQPHPAAPAPVAPLGANREFSREGATSAQGSAEAPPPPSMIPLRSETTETKYASGTEEALFGEKGPYAQMQDVLKRKSDLDKTLDVMTGNDEEIKKYYNKMLVGTTDLEALMDPSSPKFKEFSDKVTAVKGKLDTASKDLSEFQAKARIDPDRYWKDVPSTTVAMNSIAMFMEGRTAGAAIRAGLQPPTGLVQARIDKAINDDISRQKDEMRMTEASKGNEINRYRDNLKMLGDERIAEVKTKLDYLTMVKGSLDQYMQKYKGQYDQLALDEISANLDMKKQLAMADFTKHAVRTESGFPTGQAIPIDKQLDLAKQLRDEYVVSTKTNKEALDETSAIKSQMDLVKKSKAEGKPNEAAANAVRGKYAKLLQGAGVLSDSDLKAFGGSRSLWNQMYATAAEKVEGTLSDAEIADIGDSIEALQQMNEFALAKAQKDTLDKSGAFLSNSARSRMFSEGELEPMRKWAGKTASALSPLQRLEQRRLQEEQNKAAKQQ